MARMYEVPELMPVGEFQDLVLGAKQSGASDTMSDVSKGSESVLDID